MVYVYAVVGAILAIVGIVIWKKQMVGIIAGYHNNKTVDKAGLAKWVGLSLTVAGVIWIALSIVFLMGDAIPTEVKIFAPIALLIIICVVIALGCKKYEN